MSLLSQPLCHHVSTKLSHLKLAQSRLLISTLPNLNFPNLKFSLHILKLTHFNLAQSQTQPILDTPDFKLFIFQTRLVSWFVQHTNVLQHSLFVLCLRLSVLLCTNTIKNSLNPAHYYLRCFFGRKFTMLVHVSIRYTVVMLWLCCRFEELYNIRVAYQAFEQFDMKGLLIDQDILLSSIKVRVLMTVVERVD